MIVSSGRLHHINVVAALAALTFVSDRIPARRPGWPVRPLAISESLDVGSGHIHHIQFGIPGAVGNEGNLLAVRRKTWARVDTPWNR